MGYALKIKSVDFSDVSLDQVTYNDQIPCTGISVSPSSLAFEELEETKQITASLTPEDTTDTLTWSSSDENIATVNNGLVTIHGIGSATITATCGEQTETISVSATSLKISNIISIAGKYASYDVGALFPRLETDANSETILMPYTASQSLLHFTNSNEGQLFPVPYGASYVKVVTSNASSVYGYFLKYDTVDTVLYHEVEYAKELSKEAKTVTNKQAVSYGNAVGYQAGASTSMDLASYVLFE